MNGLRDKYGNTINVKKIYSEKSTWEDFDDKFRRKIGKGNYIIGPR